MTDEERRKLCAGLRHAAAYNNPICDAAAEEIERLANDLSLANDAFDKSTDEIERLAERCADAQRLAFEWMERHDKVIGFISKNYPTVMLPNLPFPSPARSEPADYIPIGGAGNGA